MGDNDSPEPLTSNEPAEVHIKGKGKLHVTSSGSQSCIAPNV